MWLCGCGILNLPNLYLSRMWKWKGTSSIPLTSQINRKCCIENYQGGDHILAPIPLRGDVQTEKIQWKKAETKRNVIILLSVISNSFAPEQGSPAGSPRRLFASLVLVRQWSLRAPCPSSAPYRTSWGAHELRIRLDIAWNASQGNCVLLVFPEKEGKGQWKQEREREREREREM